MSTIKICFVENTVENFFKLPYLGIIDYADKMGIKLAFLPNSQRKMYDFIVVGTHLKHLNEMIPMSAIRNIFIHKQVMS